MRGKFIFLALLILLVALPLQADPPAVPTPAPETPVTVDSQPTKEDDPLSIKHEESNPTNVTLQLRRGETYTVSPGEMDAEAMAGYRSLDAGDRERFLRNRELMLYGFGRLLNMVRRPIGLGRKIAARWGKADDDEAKEARRVLAGQTLKEAGTDAVKKLLNNIDQQLWTHAPFFSRVNELGTSVEAGAAGGAKVGKWGFYLIAGVGLAITVDPREKAFVAELFVDIEPARRAIPFYVGLEGFVSLFGNATYHDWSQPLKPEKGEGISLPGCAGCITPNNARMGIAKGIGFGFPGTVMLQSSLYRIPFLRIGVSPKWLGGVRAKFLASNLISAPLRWGARQIAKGCRAAYGRLTGKRNPPPDDGASFASASP